MNFDGTFSKEGSRAGVILMSPRGKSYKYSFSPKFGCTIMLLSMRLYS